jgi:hypothetical protein
VAAEVAEELPKIQGWERRTREGAEGAEEEVEEEDRRLQSYQVYQGEEVEVEVGGVEGGRLLSGRRTFQEMEGVVGAAVDSIRPLAALKKMS